MTTYYLIMRRDIKEIQADIKKAKAHETSVLECWERNKKRNPENLTPHIMQILEESISSIREDIEMYEQQLNVMKFVVLS